MTPEEIIKKVGKEKIQKALESNSGEELQELFEEEKIELTPEQMDYIAGGAGVTRKNRRPLHPDIIKRRRTGTGTGNDGGSSGFDEEEGETCDGSPVDEDPDTCNE